MFQIVYIGYFRQRKDICGKVLVVINQILETGKKVKCGEKCLTLSKLINNKWGINSNILLEKGEPAKLSDISFDKIFDKPALWEHVTLEPPEKK